MLYRSIDDPVVGSKLPLTISALKKWDGKGLPEETTFELLAQELLLLRKDQTIGEVASRLNFEKSGIGIFGIGIFNSLIRLGDIGLIRIGD